MYMALSSILIWNVRGLNQKTRRDSVHELIAAMRPHIVCLQESKVQNMNSRILLSTLGADMDGHVLLPAEGMRGGVLVAWKNSSCRAIATRVDTFSVSVQFQNHVGHGG